jgi:hypothetical protein
MWWQKLGPWARAGVVALGVVLAALGVMLAVLFALFVLKWAPEYLANDDLTGKRRAEDEGRNRTAVLAMLAGLIAVAGAIFTGLSYRLNQRGQITERFTRAIDQLGATDEAGKPKIDVVLGGIYALERIARDSKDDHPQVVEVLTAYVREHTRDRDPPPAATTSGEQREGNEAATPDEPPRLATDVQAVMDVLARRDTSQDRKQHRLNLSDTGLTALRLYPAQGGYLERVNLRRAHLEGAQLSATKLKDAILTMRTSKGRTSNGRTSERWTLEGRTSKGRTSKGRTSKGRTSEARTSEGRTSTGRTSKARTLDGCSS